MLIRILNKFALTALLLATGWPLQSGGQQTLPPPPPADLPEFTIKAQVDLVLLDVSVKDSAGGFVSNLGKEAFSVYEDGKLQTITQFASSDIPVTIGLIVDNSGSMRAKKPDVVTAALVFIQASNPLDEMFVINFNDKVRRGLPDMIPFTDDIQKLRAALTREDPAGRTSLYDAIIAGLNQLEMGRRDKKTLVLLSDGGDNASTHSMREVMREVLETHATIYTVGLYDEDDKEKNPGILQRLAEVSGGEFYRPTKLDEIVPICRQIAKDIRTRYTIGYVPTGLGKPGPRKIRVAVNAPGGSSRLTARTRTTYVVPASGNESAERRK